MNEVAIVVRDQDFLGDQSGFLLLLAGLGDGRTQGRPRRIFRSSSVAELEEWPQLFQNGTNSVARRPHGQWRVTERRERLPGPLAIDGDPHGLQSLHESEHRRVFLAASQEPVSLIDLKEQVAWPNVTNGSFSNVNVTGEGGSGLWSRHLFRYVFNWGIWKVFGQVAEPYNDNSAVSGTDKIVSIVAVRK